MSEPSKSVGLGEQAARKNETANKMKRLGILEARRYTVVIPELEESGPVIQQHGAEKQGQINDGITEKLAREPI